MPIAVDVDDLKMPGLPLFNDPTALIASPNYYRAITRNGSGRYQPSNVVGPVVPTNVALVDKFDGFDKVASWRNIRMRLGAY